MAGVSYTSSPYDRTAKDLPPGEAGPVAQAESTNSKEKPKEDVTPMEHEASAVDMGSDQWLLQKATEIFTQSSDYLDANITNEWERNLAHFNNEHAPGSFYRRKDFRRSKTFRPKTRANVKQQESALANAIFSTLNLVDVSPLDPSDPQQVMAAKLHKPLLEHHLMYRMPWFLTTQGAYQNTKVYGLCITEQGWDYHEDTDVKPAFDDAGSPIKDPETGDAMGFEETIIRKDELFSDLIEPENFRFDPMCDWRDPAGTSPYLIRIQPMYAGEVLEMMERDDSKTNSPRWRKYQMADILATRQDDYNRTRQAREGRSRVDPADDQAGNEFTTVWVHKNIIRLNGTDYVYWTLGTQLVLTEPVPLRELQPWLREGERPFVVGFSTVEAFRNYPAGDVELGSTLQQEINDVANQRLDNVKLVLNKRYFVRRGSQVDLDALVRNTPGGGVMMNDPAKDVEIVNTPDVTGSSYQEQASLSQEFDDLVGGFNAQAAGQSSVAGMQQGAAQAGAVQDYGIKIFVETWMEPVLRQLQRLIAMYETDETIIRIAGNAAQAFERLGTDRIPDSLFLENLYVRVDVGMGNTDPMRKAERLIFAATQTAQLPGMAMRIKGKPLADAIFGAVGYRDASAFVMTDEEYSQFQQENPPGPSEIDVKMRELDIRDEDNFARDERERLKIEQEMNARMEELMTKQDMKLDELMAQLRTSRESNQTQRDSAALQAATQRRQAAEQKLNNSAGKE